MKRSRFEEGMMRSEQSLQVKTKNIALRIIKLVDSLPAGPSGNVIGHQVLRSGTSVGANYRSAARAKSKADMLNKLKIVEEESDETLYWLELLIEANLYPESRLRPLMDDVEQVLAMTVASIKTLRASQRQ